MNPFKKNDPGAARLRGWDDSATANVRVIANDDTTPPAHLSRRSPDPAETWRQIAYIIAATTNSATYQLHFAEARPIHFERGALVVALPNAANILWIRARLAGVVERAVAAAGYDGLEIDWRVI